MSRPVKLHFSENVDLYKGMIPVTQQKINEKDETDSWIGGV